MRFFAAIILGLMTASLLAGQQAIAPDAAAAPDPSVAAAQNPATPATQNASATGQASSPFAPAATQPSPQSSSGASENPQATATGATAAPAKPADQTTDASSTAQAASTATLTSTKGVMTPVERREAAEAKRQFQAGVKLKSKGNLDAAFSKFSSASELSPQNLDYITAREFTRQQLAMKALQHGNKAMLDGNEIVALAEFRRALEYDPTNDYALQRLRDSLPEETRTTPPVSVLEQSVPIQLQPAPAHQDFHFRGDSQALLTQVARAYGITAQFDSSVKQQRVHFDIQDVNFATAMDAATSVTKTFWVPLAGKQVLFLSDTVENHRNFERMGIRTYYLPDLTDQQLAEMTNSLRVLLNLRYISQDKAQQAITIRAELAVLEAADGLVKSLTTGRPEVLLDMRVYAVSTSLARALGTALPTQFTMFNISPALIAGLGAGATNIINQLIASGGINQANSQAISALLAQVQSSSTSSVLTTPFVSFGGGQTLFGLNAGGVGITPTFSLNESDIRDLEHVILRTSHNDPAVMKIGERYPVINATFSPISNSSAISQVLGNQSFIAPFPSFNFEDLGLDLKATPLIHGNGDVTLKLELQIRSLGTMNVNGIPIINNRQYSGVITVKNDESSVVTGLIDYDDSRGINGYPFLARVPGLTYATSVHNKNVTEDELLVVITPHILRLPDQTSFAIPLPATH